MKSTAAIALPALEARHRSWLLRGDRPVLGERHLAILTAVQALGSLNAAAKQLRISYRDAWEKIRRAEAALGVQLIATQTGGQRGGGSRLTPVGEQLVARLQAFHDTQQSATTRAAAIHFGRVSTRARGRDCVRLATTTSLVDSGLLRALLPPLSQRLGLAVEVTAVGSGAALRLAHTGRADVVLAHAPAAEEHAVAIGDLVNRRPVMTNDFVLVGPRDDPARVRTAPDVAAALQRIAAARAPFWSRGDGSGTHLREQALLAAAGIAPGRWHHRQHAGMALVLRQASSAGAYVLTDRGTFAALGDQLALDIVFADHVHLRNPYSVLATDPYRHPGANYLAAMAVIGWLTSPAAQELIGAYRVGGRPVAQPTARRRS
ncbi:MAG: substrate-binding domain-containing protein [Deltaproteobacteria bacterium]|nr:substrate-binding domain-containing protein [Deltaproteobacteria bacterium]